MNKVVSIQKEIEKWDERISWDEYFMSISFLASSRSSCRRLHVGCVLVEDNRVISMGYNGFLQNCPHNSIIFNNHEQATVHAEQNAITDAAKRGVSLKDATAYITHYPCLTCSKLLYSSGINHIVYCYDYNNDPLVEKVMQDTNCTFKKLIT